MMLFASSTEQRKDFFFSYQKTTEKSNNWGIVVSFIIVYKLH